MIVFNDSVDLLSGHETLTISAPASDTLFIWSIVDLRNQSPTRTRALCEKDLESDRFLKVSSWTWDPSVHIVNNINSILPMRRCHIEKGTLSTLTTLTVHTVDIVDCPNSWHYSACPTGESKLNSGPHDALFPWGWWAGVGYPGWLSSSPSGPKKIFENYKTHWFSEGRPKLSRIWGSRHQDNMCIDLRE